MAKNFKTIRDFKIYERHKKAIENKRLDKLRGLARIHKANRNKAKDQGDKEAVIYHGRLLIEVQSAIIERLN